jgi:hypothetical protein
VRLENRKAANEYLVIILEKVTFPSSYQAVLLTRTFAARNFVRDKRFGLVDVGQREFQEMEKWARYGKPRDLI